MQLPEAAVGRERQVVPVVRGIDPSSLEDVCQRGRRVLVATPRPGSALDLEDAVGEPVRLVKIGLRNVRGVNGDAVRC